MNSKNLILLLSILLFSISFQNQEKNILKNNTPENTEKFSMKIGENYFVKNTFQNKELVTKKITNQKEFDDIFGMATVMGKNGTPTKIDFNKQYVLTIINPITDIETKIESINLEKKITNLIFITKLQLEIKFLININLFSSKL